MTKKHIILLAFTFSALLVHAQGSLAITAPPSYIVGCVVWGDGSPAMNATVVLLAEGEERTLVCDNNGMYVSPALPGRVFVVAFKDGYMGYNLSACVGNKPLTWINVTLNMTATYVLKIGEQRVEGDGLTLNYSIVGQKGTKMPVEVYAYVNNSMVNITKFANYALINIGSNAKITTDEHGNTINTGNSSGVALLLINLFNKTYSVAIQLSAIFISAGDTMVSISYPDHRYSLFPMQLNISVLCPDNCAGALTIHSDDLVFDYEGVMQHNYSIHFDGVVSENITAYPLCGDGNITLSTLLAVNSWRTEKCAVLSIKDTELVIIFACPLWHDIGECFVGVEYGGKYYDLGAIRNNTTINLTSIFGTDHILHSGDEISVIAHSKRFFIEYTGIEECLLNPCDKIALTITLVLSPTYAGLCTIIIIAISIALIMEYCCSSRICWWRGQREKLGHNNKRK